MKRSARRIQKKENNLKTLFRQFREKMQPYVLNHPFMRNMTGLLQRLCQIV